MEIKKTKIIVCGDSFCVADKHNRDHFSQILEDKYGYSVTNLGRGGTSNTSICFQIQQAIKLLPDIVVYSQTTTGRIEVPVTGEPFDPKLGLKNFIYPNPNETSYGSPYVGDRNAAFFSNTIESLFTKLPAPYRNYVPLSSEQQQAVRMYLTFIYDENLKAETDRWAIEYWQHQLTHNNIISVSFNDACQHAYEFWKNNPDYPTLYHTDRLTQEIAAEHIHKEIQTKVAIAQQYLL
jgi:hypothetical protein